MSESATPTRTAFEESQETWFEQRLGAVENRIHDRIGELSSCLDNAGWLDDAFTAGGLLMIQVRRRLNGSALLDEYPNLANYVARGEARPAFDRAFAAQLAIFTNRQST